MRRAGEQAATKMAAEAADGVGRFGPRTVTGPDGISVELIVTGGWPFSDIADEAVESGSLCAIVVTIVIGGLGRLFIRKRTTVHARVTHGSGRRRHHKYRVRSREEAGVLLPQLAEAVERDGLAALDRR